MRRKLTWVVLLGAAIVLAGTKSSSPRGRTDDRGENSDSRIQQGFDIAPVRLNLEGKNRALVGLGSYLVNTGVCNECHNAGPAITQYATGGNPYFGEPKIINQATYLGGGRDFGPVVPGGSAHIISRNLTPDKTGLPEGGRTFSEFVRIMRTGVDLDNLHPTCEGPVNTGCVPSPFHGDLLQVMPWPAVKDLTDHDLRPSTNISALSPASKARPILLTHGTTIVLEADAGNRK